MDWTQYRERCSSPTVLSRWIIEQTIAAVSAVDRESLTRVLGQKPVEKPDDFKADARLDMFETDFSADRVRSIMSSVQGAVAQGKTTVGEVVRTYEPIEKTWSEYLDFLQNKD